MAAHALRTSDTPASVRVLRNIDVPVFAIALVIFLVAGLPIAGFLTALGAWTVQRVIDAYATRRAASATDVRARVGLIAGSMIVRGWVVAGIIVAVGLGNHHAGLAAALLFLAVFTLHHGVTLAMRPFDAPAKGGAK